jgi:hypothetical protein
MIHNNTLHIDNRSERNIEEHLLHLYRSAFEKVVSPSTQDAFKMSNQAGLELSNQLVPKPVGDQQAELKARC